MIQAFLLAHRSKVGRPRCLTKLSGLTLAERAVKMLRYQGIEQVKVVVQRRSGVREHLDPYSENMQIAFCELEPENLESDMEVLHRLRASLPEQFLVLRADFVYDARVLKEVISADATTLAVGSRAPSPGEQLCTPNGIETYHYGLSLLSRGFVKKEGQSWEVSDSVLSKDFLEHLKQEGVAHLLRLDEMPTYLVNLRRALPVACFTVESNSDVQLGEHILMDATQKGTLDFPAQYIHPIPENWITRCLLDTPITPNIVTMVSNMLAFLGVWLFWEGEMRLGIACALAVGVLDGVDGKLARLKLMYSRFGDKLDHVLDLIYEPLWYLAIGEFLSRGTGYSDMTSVHVSIGIVALYFLDRIATGGFKLIKKIELFDFSRVDRLVRKLGARRNTNVLLLLVGVGVGEVTGLLWVILILTIATTLFHCFRAVQLGLRTEIKS